MARAIAEEIENFMVYEVCEIEELLVG